MGTSLRKSAFDSLKKSRKARSLTQRLAHRLSDDAVPAGHYYSPVPDLVEVRARKQKIYGPRDLPGIDLRPEEQLALLKGFDPFFDNNPWDTDVKTGSPATQRYDFDNTYFGKSDALILLGVFNHLKPRRVIEIGSGYSSAAMLDICDAGSFGDVIFTFVDPYPERVRRLVDASSVSTTIEPRPIQDLDIDIFQSLERNDILFIDSSHVSKVGSDVNLELLQILPKLKPGVWIHIHDIFYPFEYPSEFIELGRYWNEAYLLQAFLTFNSHFAIRLWGSYLAQEHSQAFADHATLQADGGGSIWLERLSAR